MGTLRSFGMGKLTRGPRAYYSWQPDARVSFAPLLAWHSDVPEQCRSAESFLSTSRWRRPLPRTSKSQTRFFNQHHTGAATADNRQDRRREQRDCASHQRAALRVPRHNTRTRHTCTQGCTSTSLTTVLSKRGEHTARASAKHQNSKIGQHLSIAPCCTCTSSSLLMRLL